MIHFIDRICSRRLLPIQVIAGTNSLATGRGVNIPARDVIIHPNWNVLAPRRHDIALIRLMAPLFWTSRIQPATLPTEDFTEADYPAVLTGWGTNGVGYDYSIVILISPVIFAFVN